MGFIVILPSNSSNKYYSDNHPTNFKVHLPKVISLHSKYEVALLELSYPHNFYNIRDQEMDIAYTIREENYNVNIKIKDGFYESIDSLIQWLNFIVNSNRNIPENIKNTISFISKDKSNLTKIGITRNNKNIEISLTQGICHLMGFDISDNESKIKFPSSKTSEYPADVFRGLHSMYIYTNIIERQIVGDSLVPLLRICGINNDDQGKNVSIKFNNPRYLPVNANNISSIHVNLRNEYGDNLPFRAGNVILTLQFRKSFE